MIVRIRGTLLEVGEDAVIIDRDGLSYEILMPRFALRRMPERLDQSVSLHTIQFFDGNAATSPLVPRMAGFEALTEKEFFAYFTGVKGIGIRKGLKALAEPVEAVCAWIEDADTKALSSLPGIGKRAAELIVASLRGKLTKFVLLQEGRAAQPVVLGETDRALSAPHADALEIMIALGDSKADASRWLARAIELVPECDSVDEIVRTCYRVRSGVAT